MAFPNRVKLREVGPREGFQTLSKIVPTKDKVALIDLLSTSGLSEIEVTSFVRPDLVPQMADAEEVVKTIKKSEGVKYSALYLNPDGFMRAEQTGRLDNQGWITVACSETFLAKNANTSLDKIVAAVPLWFQAFSQAGKSVQALMVSTAFGCSYEGKISVQRVVDVIRKIEAAIIKEGGTLREICLADTMGWATPLAVKNVVEKVRENFSDYFVSLHLHDTRGCGLANVYAGLELGISCFDASIGGMGGCPFARGAAGNVATEDIVYMCEEMGINTGIDLKVLVQSAKLAEKIVGTSLPGKYYKSC